MSLTRAHLAGALRATWPFTHDDSGRPNLATVCLENITAGLLVRASYAKALVTILIQCTDHRLIHPLRLTRDACKTIVRGVCKVKASTRNDLITFEDAQRPDNDLLGNERRVRVQAHGTYGPLTDCTDVIPNPWVPFPDTGGLYLVEQQCPFTGSIAARDLIRVGAAVSQLARAAALDESNLVVEFTAGPGHHEARLMIPGWYDARFTLLAMSQL